jgi:alanine-synthesizing transaminase
MKRFEQAFKMEHVRYDIRGRVTEEAERMSSAGIDILKLNTGNPAPFGLTAPEELTRALMENLTCAQGYSVSQGLIAAREAIARYAEEKRIEGVGIEDIILGEGVSELIIMAMQALLNPGDEVLIPVPDYPLWTSAVHLAGGTPVHYICDEQSEWNPDTDDMEKKITARTKAVVIINPNNPTGALYPREVLEKILGLARKHGLLVFSDEIYDRLIFDGMEHDSSAALAPDLPVVTFNGLSKSHRIAGFRCGWLIFSGNKASAQGYIDGLKKLVSIRICSNVLAQSVVPAAFSCAKASQDWLMPGGRLFEQREYITRALNEIPGISAVKPKAGLYIFPKIDLARYAVDNDEQFVLNFLLKHHILLTHGGAYSWKKPDHFRIVYLPSVQELSKVSGRLTQFLREYENA